MVEQEHFSKSPLASVLWADRPSAALAGRTGIGIALTDGALADSLRQALRGRAELYEADTDAADVVITDRDHDDGFLTRRGTLNVGSTGRDSIKSFDPQVILSAAAVIAAGYRIEAGLQAEPDDRPTPRLSTRERQVAELLVDGASNKLIARDLDISVHTAKFHVTAVMEKLGARNRADAVAIMLREGLVSL